MRKKWRLLLYVWAFAIVFSACSGNSGSSSGGAAVNEQMKLAGITPGASLTPDGKTFRYGVLIPASEIRLCLEEWGGV